MSEHEEIKVLLRDKERAISKKNFREAANICNCLGHKYADIGMLDEAVDQHQEELQWCQKLDDRLGTAVAHRNLGECLSVAGSFGRAQTHLKDYLRIAAELRNKIEIQRAYATFGRTYWLHYNADPQKNSKSLEKAEKHFADSLEWAERLKNEISGEEYAQMKCRAYLNLALVYDQRNNHQRCVEAFQESCSLASRFKFKDDLNRCHLAWANFYQKANLYEKAKNLFDDAIKSAKDLRDKVSLCEALLSKATILILLNDFDGARHLFKKAYHLRSGDDEQRAKAIVGCKVLKKVAELLKEVNHVKDLEEKCKLFDKLGDCFVELSCYKVAIDYYHRELECAIKLNKSSEDLAIIYISLGQTYLDNDQPSNALNCFYKELECRQGIVEEEVKTLLKIIEVKITLDHSFEEVEREYEYLLTKCNSDSLKKLVLKDYKFYLEQNKTVDSTSHKLSEVEKKLSLLAPNIVTNPESVEDERDEKDAYSDVSELTEESGDESNRDEIVSRKILRSRRPNKKSEFKVNEKGETPLHVACIAGDIAKVTKLIEMGHPVNPRDNAGWLPIHEASNHGHVEVVKYLLDHGAHVNDRGGDLCGGTTPLHDACVNGNASVIRILIRNGANVVRRDEDGNTPLDCLNAYIEREESSLTSDEKKDFQLVTTELTEKMKESGFDFNSIESSSKGAKRSHSSRSCQAFEKPINGLRNRREVDISSPPRKVQANDRTRSRSEKDGARAYIDEIARLRGKKSDNSHLTIEERPKIRSLINEEEVISDEWLEPDINPLLMKDKPIGDPFKGTRTSIQSRGSKDENSKSKSSDRSRNIRRLKEDIFLANDETNDQEYMSRLSDNEFNRDDDFEDEVHIVSEDFCDVKSPIKGKKSTSGASTIRAASEASNKSEESGYVSHSSSAIMSTSVHNSHITQEKILIKVHINEKTLLMPVPGKTCTVGWLAEQSADRYARNWQLKPVISLTDKDGAILGTEDFVSDVAVDNEVFAEIKSWLLDPLHQRYEAECKAKSMKPFSDIMYKLKIADSGGTLALKNVRLGKMHSQSLLSALKYQSNLTNLDFSFTDILLNDSNRLFSEAISTLPNLMEVNLMGTGLNRDKLLSLDYKSLPNVYSLNLSYNHLGDNSIEFIINSLLKSPNLTTLDLQANDFSENFSDSAEVSSIIQKTNIKLLC